MKEYTVYCHLCEMVPYGPDGERWPDGLGEVGRNPCAHKRSDCVILGTPDFGGLWHCPAHRDCPTEGPKGRRCPPAIYGKPSNAAEKKWNRDHSRVFA